MNETIEELKGLIESERNSRKEFVEGVRQKAREVGERIENTNLLQYYIYVIVDTLKNPALIVDTKGNIVKSNESFRNSVLSFADESDRFQDTFFNPTDTEEFDGIFECCNKILNDEEYSLCDSLNNHEILDSCSSIDRNQIYWVGGIDCVKPYTINMSRIQVNKDENQHFFFISLIDMEDYVERYNELIKSKERYQRLSESTFEGIVFNTKDEILDVNSKVVEMLGFEKEDIIGKNPLDFVSPKFKEKVYQKMSEDIINHNSNNSYYAHLINANGHSFPVEIKRKNYSSEKGNEVRIVAIRDLREENQAENTLNAFKLAFERSFDKIFISDINQNIIWSNESFREFYDVEKDVSLHDFINSEKVQNLFDVENLESSFYNDRVNIFDVSLTSKEGIEMNSTVTVNPIINGISDEPRYWLFFQQTACPISYNREDE